MEIISGEFRVVTDSDKNKRSRVDFWKEKINKEELINLICSLKADIEAATRKLKKSIPVDYTETMDLLNSSLLTEKEAEKLACEMLSNIVFQIAGIKNELNHIGNVSLIDLCCIQIAVYGF